MISLGNIKAKAVYYGGLAIKAVYAGAVKVWEKVVGLKNYTISGNAEVKDGKVVGVGDKFSFNQLAENGDFSNGMTGWNISRMSAAIGQDSVDFAVTEVNDGCRIEQLNKTLQANHKYLVVFTAKPSHAGTLRFIINGSSGNFTDTLQPNEWSACALIITSAQESNYFQLMPRCQSNGYAVGDIFSLRKIFTFFDLTAMGVADRVNSLADFKAWLVAKGLMQSVDDELPYFAYDAGSVKTSMPLKVMSGSTKVATYPCLLSSPLYKVGNVADTAEFATQKVTRGLGMVDMGELTWIYNTNYEAFRAVLSDVKIVAANVTANILTAEFAPVPFNSVYFEHSIKDKVIAVQNAGSNVFVIDKIHAGDAASFKAAMSGVTLVYELATPIVEPAVLPAVTEWQDGYILTTDTEIQPSEVTTEV